MNQPTLFWPFSVKCTKYNPTLWSYSLGISQWSWPRLQLYTIFVRFSLGSTNVSPVTVLTYIYLNCLFQLMQIKAYICNHWQILVQESLKFMWRSRNFWIVDSACMFVVLEVKKTLKRPSKVQMNTLKWGSCLFPAMHLLFWRIIAILLAILTMCLRLLHPLFVKASSSNSNIVTGIVSMILVSIISTSPREIDKLDIASALIFPVDFLYYISKSTDCKKIAHCCILHIDNVDRKLSMTCFYAKNSRSIWNNDNVKNNGGIFRFHHWNSDQNHEAKNPLLILAAIWDCSVASTIYSLTSFIVLLNASSQPLVHSSDTLFWSSY